MTGNLRIIGSSSAYVRDSPVFLKLKGNRLPMVSNMDTMQPSCPSYQVTIFNTC